jgi:hypothetical protein
MRTAFAALEATGSIQSASIAAELKAGAVKPATVLGRGATIPRLGAKTAMAAELLPKILSPRLKKAIKCYYFSSLDKG